MQTDGNRPVLGMIGLARRAGRAALGREETIRLLERGKIHTVVIAKDAGRSLRTAMDRAMETCDSLALITSASKEELGHALGRSTLGVVGIADEEFGRQIRQLVQQNRSTGIEDPRSETS